MCLRLFFRQEKGLSMAYADLQGQRIYYEVTGQGPALILLHSLGFNSGAWREQIKVLSPHYTVITPDIRGHGRSPHQKTITVSGVVDDVEGLISYLNVERCHLLGISMGGIFSLSYYHRNPDKVRSLILADSYATLGEAGKSRVEAAEARWASGIDMAAFGREYAADCLMPTTPASLHEELASAIAEMQPQAYLETMRAIFLADVSDVLPQVRVPTLVLVGMQDHRTPIAFSEVLAQKIPHARLVTIPQAGHLSNLDNPPAFNTIVLDFLKSLTS